MKKERNEFTTLVGACLNFFGKHLNETSLEFAEEMKALTPTDRQELVVMLKGVGYINIKDGE